MTIDVDEKNMTDDESRVQRIVWGIAGLFVAIAVIASVKLIRGHLNHFSQPNVQNKVSDYVGIIKVSYDEH